MKYLIQIPIETDDFTDVKKFVDSVDQMIDSVTNDPPWNGAIVSAIEILRVVK